MPDNQGQKDQIPDFRSIFADAAEAVSSLRNLVPVAESAADAIVDALKNGHKVLSAGNGGSAAEAMHIAEELSGRYKRDRVALPGIALCADSTALTCIANDYGFDAVFSRQVEAFASSGDILVLFTTSGNSANLVNAAESARKRGCTIVALTGRGGGALADKADFLLDIGGTAPAHVQECHQVLLHAFLERVDAAFVAE